MMRRLGSKGWSIARRMVSKAGGHAAPTGGGEGAGCPRACVGREGVWFVEWVGFW